MVLWSRLLYHASRLPRLRSPPRTRDRVGPHQLCCRTLRNFLLYRCNPTKILVTRPVSKSSKALLEQWSHTAMDFVTDQQVPAGYTASILVSPFVLTSLTCQLSVSPLKPDSIWLSLAVLPLG